MNPRSLQTFRKGTYLLNYTFLPTYDWVVLTVKHLKGQAGGLSSKLAPFDFLQILCKNTAWQISRKKSLKKQVHGCTCKLLDLLKDGIPWQNMITKNVTYTKQIMTKRQIHTHINNMICRKVLNIGSMLMKDATAWQQKLTNNQHTHVNKMICQKMHHLGSLLKNDTRN